MSQPRLEGRSRRWLFWGAILVGLAVRIATLPLPGHHDVITWKIWSYAASADLTSMYGVGGTPPTRGVVTWGDHWSTVDYPPFFLYEYALLGRIFRRLMPSYPDGLALLVAVKLPVLAATAGLTCLLASTVRRLSGREDLGRWTALAYWLNPVTFFGGEMLGYVDSLFMLPAVAGLVLAHRRRFVWAGVLVGIALSTKPQGILLGPAFALVLWQRGGLVAFARAGTAVVATVTAVVWPFNARGALANMWLAFGSFYERRDTMSAYAANVGWIINWALRVSMALPEAGFARAFSLIVPRPLAISRFQELGYPNPRPIATGLIGSVVLWALWTMRRSTELAMAAALGAFTVHAFFVLNVNMHESHQLFEVPLLLLAAALRPAFRRLFVAVSLIIALNINLLYGISLGWGWAIPRTTTGLDLSVILACANVAVLVWFGRVLRREGLADRGGRGSTTVERAMPEGVGPDGEASV